MALPNPIPDNPLRWDGWKNYNSTNFYDRLCLSADANAGTEEIEENCRQLLVWWQKKLPLKNQPSNPMAQLLRAGLDEAPIFLVAARTELLNPESRARIDAELHTQAIGVAIDELKKILTFALVENRLTAEAESRLYQAGVERGLSREAIEETLDAELIRLGAVRVAPLPPPEPVVVPPPAPVAAVATPVAEPISANGTARSPFAPVEAASDIFGEFRRMLRLSRLCLDGEDMTDDQRDAMCNMGESLGLTGGQAEDLIDEYLDQVSGAPMPVATSKPKPVAVSAPVRSAPVIAPVRLAPAPATAPVKLTQTTPLVRAEERKRFANFTNAVGSEMYLITSGLFNMGSNAPDASSLEQPITPVAVSCFYFARFPVTNAQFEMFAPAHRSMRAPWANDQHPVVYVNSLDAEKFCVWLSMREGRKYRLPTEAEWEYAARGTDDRIFPWGQRLDGGHYANFADSRTGFAWRVESIDDGYAESAPVGSYPHGKSPFGIEDLSGNVFEWCLDFLEAYKGKPQQNRRGPSQGSKRVYRGGSWKSRVNSLRGSARHFNSPDYSSNDVGFRVVCECE